MLEEIPWWWEVSEESAPHSQLGLACALDYDVQIGFGREGGLEEGYHVWE